MIAEFVDFANRGAASANHLFGSDVIAVTEDSMSMISEGCAAGRRVVALRPRRMRPHPDLEVIAYHAGEGWLGCMAMKDAMAAMV